MKALLREGKTKNVYEDEDGNLILLFKDDATGEAGKFDPGGNTVIGKIKGKGDISFKFTNFFLNFLKGEEIPTHYVSSDVEKRAICVRKAKLFGEHGLEFVCRRKAFGSFLKRYSKYLNIGVSLDYLVEITIKDDEKGDPLINDEAIIALGILNREHLEEAKYLTKKIAKFISTILWSRGLFLVDIKF